MIGMANKNEVLRRSWALPNNLKHNGAGFSTILTDLLCLRVAQMPRSRDLAIFVLTDRQTDRTDCFIPYCAYAHRVNISVPGYRYNSRVQVGTK